jgi:F-type H+-transporting ATPase subunit gamma
MATEKTMPNLKDIRRRIRSVKNMQQITKAMKMVSAARLRRAQERVVAARPYANTMTRVLKNLATRAEDYSHPLLEPRGDENYLLVLVTADKGLCGAFNTNLIKAAQAFIRENAGKNVRVMAVGRRGRDFYRRRGVEMPAEYINVTARQVVYDDAKEIADRIIELYTDERLGLDRVFVIYNEFRSVMSQIVRTKPILPIGEFGDEGEAPPETPVDYIYEQPPAQIFGRLLPKYIETQIFYALLESVASEHGARMTAMDSASRNAADLIERLTLYANRVRQAAITNEIIEVVSGSRAPDR